MKVAQDFRDIEAITAADTLVSYTCDVRPSDAPRRLRSRPGWKAAGAGWPSTARTRFLDPPSDESGGLWSTPRHNPAFFEVLGSQFLSHPAIEPYPVTVSPGAEGDPLVQGLEPFAAHDELYLCRYEAGARALCSKPAGRGARRGSRRPTGPTTTRGW